MYSEIILNTLFTDLEIYPIFNKKQFHFEYSVHLFEYVLILDPIGVYRSNYNL